MTPEEQAAKDAAEAQQLRELAAQIAQMSKLGFDPMTIRKAIIGGVNDTSSPPTVSLNISGDTDTLITQVRTLNNYTPLTGQTVLVAKQGTEIFILGAIAATNPAASATPTDNGWITATLAAGSHNGNSNGNVQYRRILDHGSWKMQWRGGWTVSGTTMVSAGVIDPDYRPTGLRSLFGARSFNGFTFGVKFDFLSDGSVIIVAATGTASTASEGGQSTSSASPGGSTSSVDPNDSTTTDAGPNLHSHGVVGSHSHSIFVDSHWHGNGSHSHDLSITSPTWVSLNGLEYFL